MVKYGQWFESGAAEPTRLREQVSTLCGKLLVCDCADGSACHAVFLAARANSSWTSGRSVRRRNRPLPILMTAALCGIARASPYSGFVPVRWPQSAIDSACRKLFPIEYTQGLKLLPLDDLINQAPFATYPEFLEDLGLDADLPAGPQIINKASRGWKGLAGQTQKGHFFSKEAVPQIVSQSRAHRAFQVCVQTGSGGPVSHGRGSYAGGRAEVCCYIHGQE